MTRPAKSEEQLAAEARARGLLKEWDRLGADAFERVQLRRRAERLERVRTRTRAAVAARQDREQQNAVRRPVAARSRRCLVTHQERDRRVTTPP